MSRIAIFTFGLLSYALGMAGLSVFTLFAGGWGIPFDINRPPTLPWPTAIGINLTLLALFGVHHSIAARQSFKDRVAAILPPSIERSAYVLLSGIALALLCWLWQPLPGMVWDFTTPAVRAGLFGLQIAGWVLVVAASFMINHFELFGLQQSFAHAAKREIPRPEFRARFGYQWVRHPLQLGVLIGIWVTPTMSMTHLFLAGSMTAYILVGLYLEEKDLVAEFGEQYQAYQRRVRMLIPIPKR